MELSFHGAIGGTTGSCHLLRIGRKTVLFDCGLFQGRREESYQRNERFGFDPGRVDAVVQSHAHVDHSGKLPMLVRRGFRGAIHATPATRDLCAIMLLDCAKILLQDAQYLNRERMRRTLHARRRKGRRQRREAERSFDGREPAAEALLPARELLPLYLEEDVHDTLRLFEGHAYGAWFDVVPGLRARFHDAGHILGSAWVEAELTHGGRRLRLVFTGDYGRAGQPILRDPEPLAPCDVLISESTYGNRAHPPAAERERGLAEALLRLAQRGRGRLLIPAFAVGRTQNLLYEIARLVHDGAVPPLDVFVDSPLATAATRVVFDHPELFDAEALREYRRFQDSEDFRARLKFVQSVDESKALNQDPRPLVVIAASGMCETGRILHHLAWHVGSPETEILIVGFQAEHTLGRRLVRGEREVRILGRLLAVRARVSPMLGFSAHADREELLAAITPLAPSAPRVFLVHGEDDARAALAEELARRGFQRVECPVDATPHPL